jgi:hypothetical protein
VKKLVGDPYWVHGPLLFAPVSLAARFAAEFESVQPIFAAMREAEAEQLLTPTIIELFDTRVLVLPGGTPTQWLAMPSGGVFLRPLRKLGRLEPESFVVPHELPDALEIGDDWVLFDSVSGAEAPPYTKLRAKHRLPIPLAPGRYVVEHSTAAPLHQLEYAAIRLRLAGASVPETVPVARVEFPIDAQTRKLAKSLRFIETEGGPFVALPTRAVVKWTGVGEGDDDDDYERACSVRGFVLGESEALVLSEPDPTAILPTDEGVVFVRWVGADQALDLVAALPFAKRWKRSKQVFVAKGPLVLFDAGLEGRKLGKRAQLPVPLRKGEYSIEHTEVDGWVQGGREVMAGFIRLRRR